MSDGVQRGRNHQTRHHIAYISESVLSRSTGSRMRWFLLPSLSILLLAMIPPPAMASPEAVDWEVKDDTGDVYLYNKQTTLTPPANPASAHMDLVGIRITGEDEAGFYLTFQVSDFKRGFPFFFGFLNGDALTMQFEIKGYPVQYQLRLTSYSGPDALDPVGSVTYFDRAVLCIKTAQGDCFFERLRYQLDDEANTVRVYVSKAALIGNGLRTVSIECSFFRCEGFNPQRRAPPGTPTKLVVGDAIVNAKIVYQPRSEESLSWYDEAPNQGTAPEYRFKHPMANLNIAALTWEGQSAAVEMGDVTPLEIPLSNRGPGRRIVELSQALEGPAENASKFQVRIPEKINLPSDSTRNITVFVTTQNSAPINSEVFLVLRGRSAGFPDELLHARVLLSPTRSLGPQHPELYFHTASYDFGGAAREVLCEQFGCTYSWINSVKDDPMDEKREVRAYPYLDGLGAMQYELPIYSYQRTSIKPIAFDNSRPVQLNLNLRSTVPLAGELRANLVAPNTGTLVATATQRIELDSAAKTIPVELAVEGLDLVVLPEDGAFNVELRLTPDATSPGMLVGWTAVGLRLNPAESGLVLPLKEVPEDFYKGTPGALMRLTPLGDREIYVNPGESRLFNVTMLNVGEDVDVAHLTASVDREGWTVTLLPGADYRIGSGESVVFGALVRAPPTAAEGDQAVVRINATSDGAPDERAFLRFTTITTSGLDLADESGLFQVEEDAREKVLSVPKENNTPGLPAWALLAGLGVAASALRRRRT